MNTHLPRRRFFGCCLWLTGIGMLRAHGVAARMSPVPRPLIPPTLAMLTKADFETCLGDAFQMEIAPGQSTVLELIEAKGCSSRAMRTGARREPFTLLFRATGELQVSQRIFKLTHDKLGTHEIFLVPLGPDEKGMRLEAVFS